MYRAIAILILVPLLCSLASLAHARLYRWVDDDGTVHYSDSVPPDAVKSGRHELSEGGIRINSVPPAKTLEEVQKEQELERLRLQQERLLEQQEESDRVLLRSFRSEDDIRMARDGKIESIDVMISVTKNNVLRQQEWLAGLLTKAGNLERTGKPVQKSLQGNIAQTERAIRHAHSTIVDKERQKSSIRSSFEQDLERFRQLKDLPESESPLQQEDPRPVLHNIVPCSTADECSLLWGKATAYVREHATTAVQTSGENIFITAPPSGGQDISLLLSRIGDETGSGVSLFLDLQCERSPRGEKVCASDRARSIIEGFRPAIVGKDAAHP